MIKATKKIAALILALTMCIQLALAGADCRPVLAASTPKATFIKSVNSPLSKCMDINWKKVNDITGHHIQISTETNFSGDDVTKSIKSEKLEDHALILSILIDTLYSRILWFMLQAEENRSISVA